MRLSNTMLHYSLFRQLKHMEGSNSETSLEPRPTWVLGYCETFIERGRARGAWSGVGSVWWYSGYEPSHVMFY